MLGHSCARSGIFTASGHGYFKTRARVADCDISLESLEARFLAYHAKMVVYIEDLARAPAEGTGDTFSVPPEINEQSCSETVRALEGAKGHLDKSSIYLMNCYEFESSNKQFIRIRSELTMLAIVYKDLHLPLATKVVADLRDVIMLHANCDVKEFKKNIRDIEHSMAERAVSAALLTKSNCILLQDLYALKIEMVKESVSINADAAKKNKEAASAEKDVAKKEKDASDALKNGKKEKKRCDAKAREMGTLKVAAGYTGTAGFVTLGVGAALAAGPLLLTAGAVVVASGAVVGLGGIVCRNYAQDLEEKATADGKNATIKAKLAADEAIQEADEATREAIEATLQAIECLKAVKLIKEEMIDSLTQFTEAMVQVSQFFKLLSSDTARYADKVKDAKRRTHLIALHLKTIKNYEKRIIDACDLFDGFEVVVQARCDSLHILNQADIVDSAIKWCEKHEASGNLGQREHTYLQRLLTPPGNSHGNTRGQRTWLGLRHLLVEISRLFKKRRETSIPKY